ncbi:uncharacterized protein ARMOST_10302 [Armillaria ostoyae]|uniref:Uncharacterized protein n=1 Tax=Armillaria ostoyae TaxID=47428 RepID=A0A284RDX6_ARMOS|nr:uncharacterized protein ARMOST_10302 [Armillaria ostoyae]
MLAKTPKPRSLRLPPIEDYGSPRYDLEREHREGKDVSVNARVASLSSSMLRLQVRNNHSSRRGPSSTTGTSPSATLLHPSHLQSIQHQYTDHDYCNMRNSFRISFYVAHIKQEYLDNSEKSLVAIHFKSALYSAHEQAVTLMYRPTFLPSVRPHR